MASYSVNPDAVAQAERLLQRLDRLDRLTS